MTIEKKTVTVDALEWFYREDNPVNPNNKLPVLFLHGLVSQGYSWSLVANDLAENGYQSFAPDWIGTGFSSKPDQRDFAYNPDAFIAALADLISSLELEKIYLVAQGFLGSVGIQYALRNPDKIEKLVILNAPLNTDAKLPWKIQQFGLPLVGDALVQDPLLVDRTLESGSRYSISDGDLDIYRRPFLQSSNAGKSLSATVRNLQLKEAMTEIETGLKQWEKPTLIIWGVMDPWLKIEAVEQLAKSKNNIELVKIPEGAHYPQEHWSEKVSNALISFLPRSV